MFAWSLCKDTARVVCSFLIQPVAGVVAKTRKDADVRQKDARFHAHFIFQIVTFTVVAQVLSCRFHRRLRLCSSLLVKMQSSRRHASACHRLLA